MQEYYTKINNQMLEINGIKISTNDAIDHSLRNQLSIEFEKLRARFPHLFNNDLAVSINAYLENNKWRFRLVAG